MKAARLRRRGRAVDGAAIERADGAGIGCHWADGLGACGDWLIAPRVEVAWLSGRWLAEAIG